MYLYIHHPIMMHLSHCFDNEIMGKTDILYMMKKHHNEFSNNTWHTLFPGVYDCSSEQLTNDHVI